MQCMPGRAKQRTPRATTLAHLIDRAVCMYYIYTVPLQKYATPLLTRVELAAILLEREDIRCILARIAAVHLKPAGQIEHCIRAVRPRAAVLSARTDLQQSEDLQQHQTCRTARVYRVPCTLYLHACQFTPRSWLNIIVFLPPSSPSSSSLHQFLLPLSLGGLHLITKCLWPVFLRRSFFKSAQTLASAVASPLSPASHIASMPSSIHSSTSSYSSPTAAGQRSSGRHAPTTHW